MLAAASGAAGVALAVAAGGGVLSALGSLLTADTGAAPNRYRSDASELASTRQAEVTVAPTPSPSPGLQKFATSTFTDSGSLTKTQPVERTRGWNGWERWTGPEQPQESWSKVGRWRRERDERQDLTFREVLST